MLTIAGGILLAAAAIFFWRLIVVAAMWTLIGVAVLGVYFAVFT